MLPFDERFYVLGVNPEPWAVGSAWVGKSGGKTFARVSPNAQLQAYQEAVREELERLGVENLGTGPFKITFYLWRKQIEYISESDRRVRKHQADATNMQKALEDACQGVLFENDRDVHDIRTVIVAQGMAVDPCVVIKIEPYDGFNLFNLPDEVLQEMQKVMFNTHGSPAQTYHEDEDLF